MTFLWTKLNGFKWGFKVNVYSFSRSHGEAETENKKLSPETSRIFERLRTYDCLYNLEVMYLELRTYVLRIIYW